MLRAAVRLKPEACEGAAIGRVAAIEKDGTLLVTVPGVIPEPAAAKVAGALLGLREHLLGKEVLVVFADGEPSSPVVCDIVHDKLPERMEAGDAVAQQLDQEEVVIDGERITFRAEKEIVLSCGDSILTLTADGRIMVRGTDLLSRSSGAVRIRGANVLIN